MEPVEFYLEEDLRAGIVTPKENIGKVKSFAIEYDKDGNLKPSPYWDLIRDGVKVTPTRRGSDKT